MAYSTSSPPVLITQGGTDGTVPATWQYSSADAIATVNTTGYITNGGALGMKVNDYVRVHDTGNNITSLTQVVTVSSTYPGAVDLRDGTTVVAAANAD